MFIDFNILNQLGSPSINSNTFANRPAAGQTGRLFVSIDTFEIYRDNGTTWDLIGGPGSSTVTGTGAATQVAYWTAAQAIGGSNNLWWDNTSGFLGVGSNVPSARIEAVKTDGIGIYANYTTNAGSGSSATAIWAKNVTNSSGYGAVIEETTPNTTAGQYPLLIKHSLSSGTAGVGMGTGVHWQLPDDAGTFKTTQLTVETINAAAATYATRYRFNVQSNGSSTPVAYLNATGLGIFTATPGAALDIHSTGIMVQLNSTSATANSLLAFQRSGSGLWRIGDQYNGGNNFFELHNTVLTNNAIQVLASSNEATFLSSKTYSTGNAIGVAVQHNLTIPNAVNVGLAAIGGVNSNLNLTLGGSTTVANTGRQGLEGSTTINFTGAGTLTMTQGTTVRAFSALSSVYAFNGSAVGTITHLAGLRICFPDNVGSAVNITNNYALLINDQTTGTGTVTYTNRWGIYQEGASDLNYMAANLLLGSTVNTGDKLQVTGTTYLSSQLTVGNTLYVDTVFNRVGIGTTSPQRTVTIFNSTIPVLQFVNTATGTTANDGLLIYQNSSDATIENQESGYLRFSTAATEQMRITSQGNVGIGIQADNPIGNGGTFRNLLVGNGAGYAAFQGVSTATASGSTLASFGAGTTGASGSKNAAAINIELDGTSTTNATGRISFYTSNSAGTIAEKMRITSDGNLGLGVTPSAWWSGMTALQIGTGGSIYSANGTNDIYLINNAYYDGTNFKYVNSDFAGISGWNAGEFIWVQAPSGTAGNNITFTTPMTLTSASNLLIGTQTDAGQKLQVNGSAYFGTSGSSHIVTFFATGVAGLEINGGTGSATVGASAYLRIGDTNNGRYWIQQLNNNNDLQLWYYDGTNWNTKQKFNNNGSIETTAPTGGTAAAWKLGSRVAATVVVNTTEYIEVDIGGTLYKLATVT